MIGRTFGQVFDNVIHEHKPIDSFMESLNPSERSKKINLLKFLKTIFFWDTLYVSTYLDISLLQGLELFYFPILDMSYDEYVTIMVSNAVFIIMTAFFWIVVAFMFQININRDPSQTDPTETLGTWMRKKFKNKL